MDRTWKIAILTAVLTSVLMHQFVFQPAVDEVSRKLEEEREDSWIL